MINRLNEPKIIGICSKEFFWMKSEGFFDDVSRISETWLLKASKDMLECFVGLLEEMRLEREEWQGDSYDDKLDDPFYTIILIEALKSGKEDFEFTDEDMQKWLSLYAISAMLELQKREGNVELVSDEDSIDKMRWSLTEKGRNNLSQ